MSKDEKVIHEAGEYQLDRKELHINAGLANAIVDGVFSALNNTDMNEDHKSDIAQAAPYVKKLLPIFVSLAPLINAEGVKKWLLEHPQFFNDLKAAEEHLAAFGSIALEIKKDLG